MTGIGRTIRQAPSRPAPARPTVADVDACLADIAAERAGYRNHSGRWASATFRLDRLLEGRLIVADREFCARYEATR